MATANDDSYSTPEQTILIVGQNNSFIVQGTAASVDPRGFVSGLNTGSPDFDFIEQGTAGSVSVGADPGSLEIGFISGSFPDNTAEADSQGLAGTLGISLRRANAGLWSLWNGNPSTATFALPIKGSLSAANCPNIWSDGEYRNLSTHNTARADNSLANANPGQGIAMQWSGKKDVDFQKHVWYANNADNLGASKFEDAPENWVGAWWTTDGLDVMEGFFDAMVDYWNNDMTQAQRDVSFIRANYNAITSEGFNPGSTLSDTNNSAWQRGAQASLSRPPDYTDSIKDTWKSNFLEYVMDVVMPDGDAGEPAITYVARARMAYDSTIATNARVLNLMNTDKIGVMVTSLDFEPRSTFQGGTSGAQGIYDACVTNGNTKGHTEPFGPGGDDVTVENPRVLANFSMLQYQYWMSLHALHLGASYVGWREWFCELYNLTGDNDLRDEWRASIDFVNKYAGYIQYPSESPGAWLALREGHRNQGNYEFLMTQITSGSGSRGTELWAGAIGSDFPYPSSDNVGPGSTQGAGGGGPTNTTFEGEGQRQSVWAFTFTGGQNLKLRLNDDFRDTLEGSDVEIRVHWLGNSTSTLNVSAFNQSIGSQAITNNGQWNITTFPVNGVTVAEDVDGAHIVVTPSGGSATLHMVEIENLNAGPGENPAPTGNITFNGTDEQFISPPDTTITFTTPGADDDFLLTALQYDGSDNPGGWTEPTGWTEVAPAQIYIDGRDIMTGLSYTIASSEPTTQGFSVVNDDAQTGIMQAFTGVDPATPFDVTFNSSSHYVEALNTNTITPASITTVTDNAVVVVVASFVFDTGGTSFSTPSGYTKLGEVWRPNGKIAMFAKEVPTPTTEQPGDITIENGTGQGDPVCWTIALRPA